MKLLISVDDYVRGTYLNEDIVLTCAFIYIALWCCQGILTALLAVVGGEICGKASHRGVLSRLFVDTIAMAICSLLGYQCFVDMGGLMSLTTGNSVERLYTYYPGVQRLLLFQLGYTFKTVGDAIFYKDGIISLVHHIATGAVVGLALHPFLHTHAVFFVGLSEISTTLLCIVICFQKDRGVPLLAERYPTVDTAVGIAFSILFVFCRIILWGWYSYYFWTDCLDILSSNSAHSVSVVIWYLVANTFLSLLQAFWLIQIFKAVLDLFVGKKAKSS